jgi:hypothetical protein
MQLALTIFDSPACADVTSNAVILHPPAAGAHFRAEALRPGVPAAYCRAKGLHSLPRYEKVARAVWAGVCTTSRKALLSIAKPA